MLKPFNFLNPCLTLKALMAMAFLCCLAPLAAQNYYSTDPDYILSKAEGNNLLNPYLRDYPDTSITQFHDFLPRNFLGNIGLASAPLFLNERSTPLGFRFFEAPTQLDRIREEDIRYHHTQGPYADLTGIAGSKQLQLFKLNFTHTFHKRLNVGLKLNRYNSVGYYNKQQTFVNNILFNTAYQNKSKRFGYYGYFLTNLNKNRENGGISDSVLNDSTVLLNKGLLAVRLDSAARENREFKIMLNPWFLLNPKSDSNARVLHLLSLKTAYTSHKYRYKDQGVAEDQFYYTFYYDTLLTNDSAHAQKFSNSLEYTLSGKDGLGLSIGYKNEYNRVWQKNDSLFFNQGLVSSLQFLKTLAPTDSLTGFTKRWHSGLDFETILLGPNAGNLKVEYKNRWNLSTRLPELRFNLLYEIRTPDYFYNSWNSNHFYWRNKFKNVQQFQASLGLQLAKRFSADVLFQSFENYLYFDQEALPQQYHSGISNLSAKIRYSELLFHHLGLNLTYIYQQSSNSQLIRLPVHHLTANVYYYAALFKNNMQVQVGAQYQAYQSFESYAYMPATQVFYLQNGFYTGNFPFVDLYLNARIRPASFFVKMENVLAGLYGTNFALVQGYYQPQRAFRFGLKWMFFD